jgi:hypothetical protein
MFGSIRLLNADIRVVKVRPELCRVGRPVVALKFVFFTWR